MSNRDQEIAQTLTNLASTYRDTDRHAQAEETFVKAIDTYENQLDPEHPDLADCLHQYAQLLEKTDREEGAKQLRARAKSIRAKSNSG
jgi:tetratricopeptide (TPR) repeat protein